MFGSRKVKELKLEVAGLQDKVQVAKNELADVKHQKKIEEEDIKHMVRLKEERLEVKFEKQTMELERENAAEVATVKDEYRNKLEERLIKETENIKEMYSEILNRLPDINVRLKGDV